MNLKMVASILDNGKMDTGMEEENKSGQMDPSMMVFGIKMLPVEKEG